MYFTNSATEAVVLQVSFVVLTIPVNIHGWSLYKQLLPTRGAISGGGTLFGTKAEVGEIQQKPLLTALFT